MRFLLSQQQHGCCPWPCTRWPSSRCPDQQGKEIQAVFLASSFHDPMKSIYYNFLWSFKNCSSSVLAAPHLHSKYASFSIALLLLQCQNMTFTETNAWILTDEWKNTYIMHASGANTTDGVDAAAAAAVFPPGWSVAQVPLNGAFTISPRMTSAGDCFYTIIRDSQDNSYHQFGCGGATFPTDFNPACPAATKSGYVPGSTPSPPPSSPPPPASKQCSYDGNYKIVPTLLNCASQYVAWPSPSNCNNTAVGLKTQNQLGGKPVRASWTIKGEGRKPLNIVAAKDCAAKQLDISTEGIVLTSVKFPWEIQPIGGSCNTVNIVAPSRNGAKYLGIRVSNMPGNCSKKFTFTSTAGPQNVFKLVKTS